MKTTYETGFRPNFEARQTFVTASCGLCCVASLHAWLGVPPKSAFMLSAIFGVMTAFYGWQALLQRKRQTRLKKTETRFMTLATLDAQREDRALYMGEGFAWGSREAQIVADLYQDHEAHDALRARGQGATWLHGIGAEKAAPVHLHDDETKGHVLIVGTTGAGKTRLFDLLVTQSILRREATIIVDPKGDDELRLNAEAAFQRVGRAGDFSFFHPSKVDTSCAIDPLANYQRSSELASRLAAIIPGTGDGEVFRSYSQNALMSIFYGIIAGGAPPTILDVQEPLTQGSGRIVFVALQRWARTQRAGVTAEFDAATSRPDGWDKKAAQAVKFYHRAVAQDPGARDHDLDNLIGLFEHDATHFSKMVASLIPVIGQLCSGELKYLLSPNGKRLPKSGEVVNLAEVIEQRRGLYVGLDTLSDAIVGSRIGQLVLSDLTALAGARYNAGNRGNFVNIFVDEASEVVTEQLIQLLNKGRGAGFRLFVATQTLADLEARSGSKAFAEMMAGNMNSVVMLRTINAGTQQDLAEKLPEVPLSYVMKTSSTSLGTEAADAAYGKSHGERLMQEKQRLIAPETFGDLTDLEYFVRTPRGRLLKGRLPILEAPDIFDDKGSARRTGGGLRAKPRKDEHGAAPAGVQPAGQGAEDRAEERDTAPEWAAREHSEQRREKNMRLKPETLAVDLAPEDYPPHPNLLTYFWKPTWEAIRWIVVKPELRPQPNRLTKR